MDTQLSGNKARYSGLIALSRELTALVIGLALLVCAGGVGAATVYKSVDAEGRVTFSDQPPADAERVEILEYRVSDRQPSALDLARLEAMRETTDRMAADRREREAARARVRSESAAARAASAAQPYQYSGEYRGERYYYPAYPFIPRPVVRPPYHRPPHGRPPHVRPPYGKPPGLHPPNHRPGLRLVTRYSQYPANLIRRGYRGKAREVFYGR